MMYLVFHGKEPLCVCGSKENAIIISQKLLSPFDKDIKVVEVLSHKVIVDYAHKE